MDALGTEQSQQNTDVKFREREHGRAAGKGWGLDGKEWSTVATRWGLARARKHICGRVLLYVARRPSPRRYCRTSPPQLPADARYGTKSRVSCQQRWIKRFFIVLAPWASQFGMGKLKPIIS